MIRLPNLNRMRNTHRQSQQMIERIERMEKRNKERLTWKKAVSIVILALIIVPLRSENANLAHGIVSWCAICAYLLLNYFEWRHLAPLTRWRRTKTMAGTVGAVMLVMPFILMLFEEEITPEHWELYYFMWGAAALLFILFLFGVHRWRRIKADSSYRAEQIRRRMARQKRMELL